MAAIVLLLNLFMLPWNAVGQVATATATTGTEYVVACYVNNKYYALPHVDGSNTYSGTEVTLNSINKVNTSTASSLSWTLTEGSTSGQFYISYTSGNNTKYLTKSGTTGDNKKISTVNTASNDQYWEFTLNSGNNDYTVKSLKSIQSGTTGATLIYLGYVSSKYGVYASGSAGKIILLEIGDVPDYTITPQSNNTAYGTVSLSESVITGSPKPGCRYATPAYTVYPANSATVSQMGNAFTVIPSANTTVTINFEPIPTHILNYSATNGSIAGEDSGSAAVASGASVAEGAIVTLTATPASSAYKFTSWSDGNDNSTLSSTTDNPTIFTMGSSNVTITANFTARTATTVTLHHGEGGISTTNVNTYTDATLGEVIEGQTPGAVNGWTFYGWVKSYTSGTPTLITSSEKVGETKNLYAVYKKGSNTFSLVTSTNDLAADAVYMIACYHSSTYKFMNNPSDNYMDYVTGNNVSDGSYEYSVGKKFVLGGTEGAYTLMDGSKYLTATSSQQYLGLATFSGDPTNYQKWAISFSNSYVQISNNGNSTNKLVSYYASQGYFNCYSSSSLYLYKQITNDLTYSTAPTAEKCHVYYNANGATTGDVPVDNNEYNPSDGVTVLGNTGYLAKTGHTWNGWNTDAEGNGDSYNAGGEFTITANTTLYAQWTINEYSYTLTDDDNSEAELEVDGSPVAANANIQYNKEVTVNVVVSEGYVYHISVINDATSEAVTVNNDKFNMPASSVTVTVTSEVNPYATIELTSANMEQMDNAGTAYAYIKTITINGYNWEAKAFNTTNEKNYLQINTPGSGNPAGSYIKLPIVNGKIETITCTVNSSNRYLYFNTTNSTSNPIATGGNGTVATSITIDMTNVVYQTGYIVSSGSIQITNISVKYRPYQDMSGTTLPTTLDKDVAISIPSNTNATAIDLTIPASSGIIIKSGASLTVSGTLTNEGGNANKIIIEDGGQLVIANAVNATLQKSITGYDDEDDPDGWYTIASPVVGTDMSLSAIGDYDLFKYDETSHTWLNEYNHEDDFTSTSVAEGFLYANGANQTLPFAGEMKASNAEVTQALTYSSTDGKLKGFNLVGNPFTCNLTSSMVKMNGETLSTYYVSEGHANLKVRTLASTPIKPGQGFFVQTPSACDLVFNPSSKDEMDYKPTFISIEAGNSEFTDMAYIQLGYGNTLRKMSINDNTPLVYVMNEGADYAAATVDELKGSMPICFKAASTGQYTISVNTEGLDMSYLHLIDRFTGEDVNLLLEPTYSFIATKGDNESRFILSFTANCFNDSESETFAYQAGNDIFVSGEGELQIFDVTGRMVSTTYVNGIETIKLPSSGMYIFRLVGTEVKTQKIVVR